MNIENYLWFIYGVSIGIIIGINIKKKPSNDFDYIYYSKRRLLNI